jgi:hypothetical protein
MLQLPGKLAETQRTDIEGRGFQAVGGALEHRQIPVTQAFGDPAGGFSAAGGVQAEQLLDHAPVVPDNALQHIGIESVAGAGHMLAHRASKSPAASDSRRVP